MKIRVLFFASCREIVGMRQCDMEVADGISVAQLKRILMAEFPGLNRLSQSLTAAVNAEYVNDSAPLQDADEVALIPPVSGGSIDEDAQSDTHASDS